MKKIFSITLSLLMVLSTLAPAALLAEDPVLTFAVGTVTANAQGFADVNIVISNSGFNASDPDSGLAGAAIVVTLGAGLEWRFPDGPDGYNNAVPSTWPFNVLTAFPGSFIAPQDAAFFETATQRFAFTAGDHT